MNIISFETLIIAFSAILAIAFVWVCLIAICMVFKFLGNYEMVEAFKDLVDEICVFLMIASFFGTIFSIIVYNKVVNEKEKERVVVSEKITNDNKKTIEIIKEDGEDGKQIIGIKEDKQIIEIHINNGKEIKVIKDGKINLIE